jgi:hypothetical protein
MRLRTVIWILVTLIVVGSVVWQFGGIKFYSARIEKKK